MKVWSVPIWAVVEADDQQDAAQIASEVVKPEAYADFDIEVGEPYEEKEESHVGA